METKNKENQIYKLHTCCKNCIFAIYQGKTQTGCRVGQLEKIRKIDSDSILECYDNEKEFFVLNYHLCLYYRNKAKVTPGGIDKFAKQVRKKMQIKYHLIIIFNNDHGPFDLENTFVTLEKQKIKPQIISLINRNEKWNDRELIEHFKDHLNIAPVWKVRGMKNIDLSDEACIDLAFDSTYNKPYSFYITCYAGYLFEYDFFEDLDVAINDNLKRFHIAYDDDITIVPKQIHSINSGNAFKPLKEKIEKHTRIEELLCLKMS